MSADATPLDAAYRAQEADPDPVLRLRFHERVLDAELLLLLAEAAVGDRLRPEIFELAEGRFALAFDRDDRLAAFVGAPAPFVALAGRRLVALLAGQGVGIGLNLGAPSAMLLPAASVEWMAGMAGEGPPQAAERLRAVAAPGDVPPGLIAALGPKLAAMAGVVGAAHLVEARFAGGDGAAAGARRSAGGSARGRCGGDCRGGAVQRAGRRARRDVPRSRGAGIRGGLAGRDAVRAAARRADRPRAGDGSGAAAEAAGRPGSYAFRRIDVAGWDGDSSACVNRDLRRYGARMESVWNAYG